MRFNQKAPSLFQGVALFFLLLLPVFCAHGEINSPGSPPSQAVPLTIHVPRGEAISFKLSVYGPPESVKFLLRSKPVYGTLSAATLEGHGDVVVTYRHSGEKMQTQDRFTYAAKTNGGVSAAAEVTIDIDDPPSKLVVTNRLDFGDVPVSESKELELQLSNLGGAPATGTMDTDTPWQIRENPAYLVPGGDRRKFHLIFTPDHVGPVEGSVIYSSDRGTITEIYGRGVESYYLDTGTLRLQATEAKAPPVSKVTVHNRLRDNLHLQITAPSPIEAPATLEIPPLGTAELAFSAPAGLAAPIDDFATISDGTFTGRLHLLVNAAPAVLMLDQTKLDFGPVAAEGTKRLTLTIKNTGASAATVSSRIDKPFQIASADMTFDLAPGASRPITLAFAPTQEGIATATLTLSSSTQNLTATCTGEGQTPQPITKTVSGSIPIYDMEKTALAQPTPKEYATLPAVKSLTAIKVNPTSVTLEWPVPSPAPKAYRFEQLLLVRDAKNKLALEWQSLPNPDYAIAGGKATMRVTGLAPHEFLVARVVAVDEQGRPTHPSPELRVQTPPRQWPSFLSLLMTLLAGLIGYLGWNKWKNRNAPLSGF
ncbi:MAG: choice-of-anchor D domain-containing protein [Chthoniobacteraceae bacterium]